MNPMSRRSVLMVLPALSLVVSAGCADAASLPERGAAVHATAAPVVPPKAATTAVTPTAASTSAVTALTLLGSIAVARENPAGYARSRFKHWTDADGDGCNTREEVLIAESTSKAQVDPYGCKVIEGDWVSRYDGIATSDPASLDIDHFVPLKEAWDSGASAWTASRREQFANDLSDPRGLVAVTASTNRAKGEKDPPQWMPPNTSDFCPYLSDWVAVKAHWDLSMDESEYRFIEKRLRGQCAGMNVQPWGRGSTQAPVATTQPPAGTASGTPSEGTVKGSLPTVHPGSWCSPQGARGTYKGTSYVCSTTRANGEPYAGNRARWRQE